MTDWCLSGTCFMSSVLTRKAGAVNASRCQAQSPRLEITRAGDGDDAAAVQVSRTPVTRQRTETLSSPVPVSLKVVPAAGPCTTDQAPRSTERSTTYAVASGVAAHDTVTDDPLTNVGSQDLTIHVDFTALRRASLPMMRSSLTTCLAGS